MAEITRIKTGGRQKGTPNKTTSAVRQAAMAHADDAITLIADLMANSENDAVRLQAAKELLDRSCGKTVDATEVKRFENADQQRGKPMQTLDEMMREML